MATILPYINVPDQHVIYLKFINCYMPNILQLFPQEKYDKKQSQSLNKEAKVEFGYEVVFYAMFFLLGMRLSITSRLAVF